MGNTKESAVLRRFICACVHLVVLTLHASDISRHEWFHSKVVTAKLVLTENATAVKLELICSS